jgi:hypothetical protein
MRLASRAICLIVIASFAFFAVDQTRNASQAQQRELAGESSPAKSTSKERPGTVHKVVDEVSDQLTSPFSAVTSGSSDQWVKHGLDLVLSLAIYGFGLSYLARSLRL